MHGQRIDVARCPPRDVTIADVAFAGRELAVIDLASLLPPQWAPLDGVVAMATLDGRHVTLDLGNDRIVVHDAVGFARATRDMAALSMRRARPGGGAVLDVMVEVASPGGALWFMLDAGNVDRVIVAPHAARMLGIALPDAPDARVERAHPLAPRGLAAAELPIAVEDILYDGNFGARAMERWVIALDLLDDHARARPSQPDPRVWVRPIADVMLRPSAIEDQRAALAERVVAAQERIDAFARANGWADDAGPHFDAIEVFDDQEALWRRILDIHGVTEARPLAPKGLSAALEGRVLTAVSPALQVAIAPAYAQEPDAWTRLLAHEIGHRLHIDVLDGDEDAMGRRGSSRASP